MLCEECCCEDGVKFVDFPNAERSVRLCRWCERARWKLIYQRWERRAGVLGALLLLETLLGMWYIFWLSR